METKGIDPIVMMGTLEALLTGTSYEEVAAGDVSGRILTSDNQGVMVVALTRELQRALSSATPDRLGAVAVSWLQTEEFRGGMIQALAPISLTR